MLGKLNFAIIGTGNIAQHMADTIKKVHQVKAYAVASRSADRAASFAGKNGFKKYYGSYEELVEDPKVDLVYIATPHSEHYDHARLCIEHGKPVLVEKAFTVNEGQARDLFALAEKKGVFITEAMWVRYMPMLQTMQEVLSSKVIGEPVMLTANLGYNIRHKERLVNPKLAGGALLDVGVYVINFASMLFGDDIREINSSCTFTATKVDEQDSITFKYRNGRMAVLNASMVGISDRKGIVYGTKGYMIVENINNFESLTVFDAENKKVASYKRPRQHTGYEYEVQACVRALKEGWLECPEMPHEETLTMLHIMDFIRGQFGLRYPCEEVPAALPVEDVEAALPVAEVTDSAEETQSTIPVNTEEPAETEEKTESDPAEGDQDD